MKYLSAILLLLLPSLLLAATGDVVIDIMQSNGFRKGTLLTPSNNQYVGFDGSGNLVVKAGGGGGTVTSFAFTNSTGITGTVTNATSTPTLSLALTSAAVGLANVENTALSTWAGSTNLTTLGTITTGTWSATNIALAKGGTGTALTDPNADRILFWDDSAGEVSWLTAGTGLTITGTTISSTTAPGGVTGNVQYNVGGALTGENGFDYDETGNILTVGALTTTFGKLETDNTGNNGGKLTLFDFGDTDYKNLTVYLGTWYMSGSALNVAAFQGNGSALTALNGSQITTGTVPADRLGSSGGAGKYLRYDNTWQTIGGGGDALVANPLSQFAATTSAQLRGVLTDEEGTGVFLTANGSAANLTSFPTLNQNTTGTAGGLLTSAITGLTADGSPDGAADYVMTYDASATAMKKVLLNNLPGGGGGSVATDTIFDAKGDLAVGTGSNTASRLAVGTNGHVLTADSAEATGVKWAAAGGGGGLTNITETLHTSSPNNTVNAEQLEVTGGTTNTDLVLTPKGTGAFKLGPAPDGTASPSVPTGGNKNGDYAVNLQLAPLGGGASASRVASGRAAFVAGDGNTASGAQSIAMGQNSVASADLAVALGNATASGGTSFAVSSGTASSNRAFASGLQTIASADDAMATCRRTQATASAAFSHGEQSLADRWAMRANAGGNFASVGDAQTVEFTARNKTTNNTATELYLDGSSTRLTIPSGKVFSGTVNIVGVKSDGSAVARYLRQVTIKNVSATTSLVGSVITIGTDEAAGTSISVTADDTNDSLKIEVTGITSETWRWVATIEGAEVAYGN